ncbi:MK13 kinase, partial [Aramus guarauna]|nr:MK13 kinase [Aramus guarauna]
SAIGKKTEEKVAIKKLCHPFQSEIFAKRAYRELMLLKHMQQKNISTHFSLFLLKQAGFSCHLEAKYSRRTAFAVSILDLGCYGTPSKTSRASTEARVDVLQIKTSLLFCSYLLQDLKLGNLAVNEDCQLKILGFGLARHADAEMTSYVVTCWYRAPEVLLNWMRYSQTVDIQSIGCIMAEMLTRKTLF